jgi:hypothetical protein
MHRFMVNIKVERIFNRIFEIQKSTRNAKNNAKIRALGTSGSSVYQVHINHDAPLISLHSPLRCHLVLALSTLSAYVQLHFRSPRPKLRHSAIASQIIPPAFAA